MSRPCNPEDTQKANAVFGWKLATLEEIYPQDNMQRLNLKIREVDFVASLIGLYSKGIDVILGMDWLSKHKVPIEVLKSP
jgi:hypothetical protein